MDVYFFTGTGTDVGKTYCASRLAQTSLAQGRRVGVYKPVASGCAIGDDGEMVAPDAKMLWESAGGPLTLHTVCPQRFEAALAPPEAAKTQNTTVDEDQLLAGIEPWIDYAPDLLIVEGAGGLFSPLSESMLNIDYALRLRERLPEMRVVLVAPNRLGVIHDCVACVRAAASAGLTIDHVLLNQINDDAHVLSDASILTNARSIERWTGCVVTNQERGLSF
ncbi:dethiobiotin synthase [Rhodopirellula sp. ICT_H3.1]|uniref:ATP-dependent dethiobiotin synthetase BioD n=2 Tax=Aporhodopirellula aestuarii TaxID=2950107 RepID=A0ABT0TZW4_9BACT|nr:dethiobiotin synthase [Aporhodopirellula aestuarii]